MLKKKKNFFLGLQMIDLLIVDRMVEVVQEEVDLPIEMAVVVEVVVSEMEIVEVEVVSVVVQVDEVEEEVEQVLVASVKTVAVNQPIMLN